MMANLKRKTKIMRKILIALSCVIVYSCTSHAQPKGNSEHPPFNALYTKLLNKYVNASGFVNYKGLKGDAGALNQ